MFILLCILLYVFIALVFAQSFNIFKDRKGKYEILDGLHYCVLWPVYLFFIVRKK